MVSPAKRRGTGETVPHHQERLVRPQEAIAAAARGSWSDALTRATIVRDLSTVICLGRHTPRRTAPTHPRAPPLRLNVPGSFPWTQGPSLFQQRKLHALKLEQLPHLLAKRKCKAAGARSRLAPPQGRQRLSRGAASRSHDGSGSHPGVSGSNPAAREGRPHVRGAFAFLLPAPGRG